MNLTNPTSNAANTRRKFATLLAAAGVSGMSIAQAQPAPREGGPGMGHRAGHGPREQMMNNPKMQERMLERRTSHMLDAVDATPEQRSRVMQIARAAFNDIAPLREQSRTSRSKGREMLFAANLDRAGLEKLRQEQMALRNSMGQRTLNGMLDAMAVLSPEQRAKLAARKKGGMEGGVGGGMGRMH